MYPDIPTMKESEHITLASHKIIRVRGVFMSKLVISGGAKLKGEIAVEGSKNAVLPILAASLLNGGESIIKNCPRLKDVEVMIEILKKIGCSAKVEDDVITINSAYIGETQIPVELAAEMRSSIIFMGPMLARCGKVTISYPGGCVPLLSWIFYSHRFKIISFI